MTTCLFTFRESCHVVGACCIYNTLLLPHMSYCILSWGSQIDKIRLLQKKAIRNVTKSAYTAQTEPLHKEYNILKVQDMYQLAILKFYCKLVNNNLPHYFNAFTPKFSALLFCVSFTKRLIPRDYLSQN